LPTYEKYCIKIVLDYFINSKDQELHNITIFSDSQSALGILTLNWKSENYFQSINEIKSQINYLKEQGVVVSFNWTPVHASIKGSEIADQLAKEAAKEAEALELNTQVFTKQDIRKAARDVVTKKWQVHI
jgi:ribonuclease HI